MAKDNSPDQPQVVERTGLALVHEGERIFPDAGSMATLATSSPNIVNYYFPVEIEIIGQGTREAFAEMIYDALQREFNALA
jgi:hypothetical protein